MSYGGPTWDTAGTLTLGSDNTFDPAAATENGPEFTFIESVGWWSYTAPETTILGIAPADSSDVRLRFYEGADYASKVQVTSSGFEDPTEFYPVVAGVTYHLMVGTAEFHTSPALYQVTVSVPAPLNISPWIDTLSVRTDNQVIVSRGALWNDNISTEFQYPHEWYGDIFGGLRFAPGRQGAWGITQTLGGPDITDFGGVNCIWQHAKYGDFGSDGAWTGVCSAPGVGDINPIGSTDTVSWAINVPESGGAGGDTATADIIYNATGCWFGEIRSHVEERGAFNLPDPVADGYPEDAEIEWEGGLKLLKIELAGDAEERPALGETDSLDPLVYALRRAHAPGYLGGDPSEVEVWAEWTKGQFLDYDPGLHPEKDDLTFQYTDGDAEWTEVDHVVGGDTGWDLLAPNVTEYGPDETVVAGLARSVGGPPPDVEGNSRQALLAVRYTFQSPRYRWHYTGTPPVTRQHPRDDGRGLSAGPRLYPPSKAQRIYGGLR